ncbi:MAG TPA: bifunctional sulfate adenylyltransferase/adenylylsulfate kinase [Vicinamibacteria bacterium]|nr:bifunctional sulfate adenylyltransferase/adenylylsulfate kinase [Vicinamibacteria bacterium]
MTTSAPCVNTPYGGTLVDLLVRGEERLSLLDRAGKLPSLQISNRSLHDLGLLAVGAFSPLRQFVGRADYESILDRMRLADGTLWPIPLSLPVTNGAERLLGREVALRSPGNEILAVMQVEEVFGWDLEREASALLGRADPAHPLVAEMFGWGRLCISGPLQVVNPPRELDFAQLRLTPAQVRVRLGEMQAPAVVAFQTRNPLHRSHEELTKRATTQTGGVLLLHPVVGLTKPGDVDHFTRVRTYEALLRNYFDPRRTLLSLLPLAMRMAGPREALWHALIRRNYGATHFVVGRDHAGPGKDSRGKPFFGPEEAQALALAHAAEMGIDILAFGELVYLPEEDRFEEAGRVTPGTKTLSLSGSQVREEYLARGQPLPAWFTRPEVASILAESAPPRHKQGFCVWLTGLSGAGKSATAEALTALLLERGRQVTLLDGDIVRTHLSKGLGFSREDRDTNIRRIGFVAAEVARHGGVAICAAVSPYRAARSECRTMVGEDRFLEVFVDTPIEVCEARDTKGLYAKARRGELPAFTGISDPYEPPLAAELVLETSTSTPEDNARRVVVELERRGFVAV